MIQPAEGVQFFTVLPDPDRSYIPRQIIADVLVVQGIDADRYAGPAHCVPSNRARTP